MRSIHSSLAIEHNSLSIEQVSDILNGKKVVGSIDEIQEVMSAIDTYKLLDILNLSNIQDLLKAHKEMTKGLINECH